MPFNNPVTDGARGGHTRAAKLTPAERSEGARKAAMARVNAAARIAELEARFEARIDALTAEVAELRDQRIAA